MTYPHPMDDTTGFSDETAEEYFLFRMRKRADKGGLSRRGAHLLGFNAMCRCRHTEGLHEASGSCAVLGCECKKFERVRPVA